MRTSRDTRGIAPPHPQAETGGSRMKDADRLTEHDVADRAGTTEARIRQLVELGILKPEAGAFRRLDVLRARVVVDLDAVGIDANAVATALATGDLSLGYLESVEACL